MGFSASVLMCPSYSETASQIQWWNELFNTLLSSQLHENALQCYSPVIWSVRYTLNLYLICDVRSEWDVQIHEMKGSSTLSLSWPSFPIAHSQNLCSHPCSFRFLSLEVLNPKGRKLLIEIINIVWLLPDLFNYLILVTHSKRK